MGIAVLGPVVVDEVGGLQRRDRVVLEVLVVNAGAVVSSEVLADALWGDALPASWSKVVQGCIVRLRKGLGPRRILTNEYGYQLVVHDDELDARRFELLLGRARDQLVAGDPDRAAYLAAEASSLWRGDAFPDLVDWETGRAESERLEGLRREAQEVWLESRIAGGHAPEDLEHARAQVAEAPFRERRWALFARALYLSGRQADALEVLGRARRLLREELGLDPGPELVALEEAILRQDPSLATGAAVEPSATCPYRGLLPYEAEDSDAFFGRDADVAACLRRLRERGVLAVVGPSGTGKSSLVRAGVVATLRRDGEQVVVTTPGARPLDSVAGLPRHAPWPVLVVDQAEEAVALCQDPGERASYFGFLGGYAGQVVVTLRADRLGDLSTYPEFAGIIETGLYLLTPMEESDLRAAVGGPARKAGLRLDGGLVDLLVREVEGEPGALPLLSHVLRQTWEHREGPTLTVAGYRRTGGIRDAVAQSAEALYATLDDRQREQVRALFLRLVSPNEEGEPVRARVARSKVVLDSAQEHLVEALVSARLVSTDEGDLQIAHEALARAWPRLTGWLEADVEGQRIFRHLSVAAETWDTMGRPVSELYRGARLAGALQWADRHSTELTPVEQGFLAAGEAHAERERVAAEEGLRAKTRSNRRLQVALGGAALLLVAATVAGMLAVHAADRADDAATTSESRRLAAQALGVREPDVALLLALEALHLDESEDARAGLLTTLQRVPSLLRVGINPRGMSSFALSPDGSTIAVSEPNGVTLYDAATLKSREQHADIWAENLRFTTDGRMLLVESGSPPVVALDVATMEPVSLLGEVPLGEVGWSTALSGDGRFFAAHFDAGRPPGPLLVWDLERARRPIAKIMSVGYGLPLQLSQRGRILYVAHPPTQTLRRYAAASGRLLGSVAFEYPVDVQTHSMAISPDGSTLAVVGRTGVHLVDSRHLEVQRVLPDTEGRTSTLAFSGDGRLLAAGSERGTAVVWDVAAGEVAQSFSGHRDGVRQVAFSPDGRTLYSGSTDERLLAWDLDGSRGYMPARTFDTKAPETWPGWLSGRGARMAYVDDASATVSFRDVATGRLTSPTHTGVDLRSWVDFEWHPAERMFAVLGQGNGFVELWDGTTGRLIARTTVPQARAVAFSPDGSQVLVGRYDGTLVRLDTQGLARVGESLFVGSPMEELIASSSAISLWSITRRESSA